jgi:intracellular sulfur oxidation DsrE/DsrF family protein
MESAGFADRRKDRSENTLGALTRLLEAARRRAELEALAVSDGAGVLVAGAGAAELCDELAAMAPLIDVDSVANDTIPSSLMALERRLRVQRLAIDGVEVFICGAGAGIPNLSEVESGCQRILGRRRLMMS